MTKKQIEKSLETIQARPIEQQCEMIDDLCGDIEEYITERSDTWQESDKGIAWSGLLEDLNDLTSVIEEKLNEITDAFSDLCPEDL